MLAPAPPAPQPAGPASGLARLRQRALAQRVPLAVHLELTHACNQRCVICYNPPPRRQDELEHAQWCTILDDLRRLGTLTVTLTGGEPLAYPQLLAVAEEIRRRHLALRILSNGTLVDDTMARHLADLQPLSVELSLHGATAATHDRTTRCHGSFAAMWNGLERLRARGVRIILKSPITRLNAAELGDMIALARRHDLPLRLDPTLTPCDGGDPAPLGYTADSAAIAAALTRLQQVGQLPRTDHATATTCCGLGRLTLAIDPLGNVFPCLQWRHTSLGNVREQPLETLWRSSPVRRQAEQVAAAACQRLCDLGPAAAAYPYCPALAAQLTGDPLQPGAPFLEQAQIAHRLRGLPP